MFYQDDLKDIYGFMRKNQLPSSLVLNTINNQNLSLKSIAEKSFDCHFLELMLQNEDQLRADLLDRVYKLLIYFQNMINDPQSVSNQIVSLLCDRSGGQVFLQNMQKIIKLVTACLAHSKKSISNSSQVSMNQIEQQSLNANTTFQDLLNWYVGRFLEIIEVGEQAKTPILIFLEQLIESISKAIHPKLLDRQHFQVFNQILPQILQRDEQFFEENERKSSELLYQQLRRTQTLIEVIKAILPKSLPNQGLLNAYGFLYFSKSLKYFEISGVPVYYEFLLKLLKNQKDDSGWQIDMFEKNKMQKYFREMFEVLVYNFHKANLVQLYEFCQQLSNLKTIGFDLLQQLNFYHMVNETDYKLNSLLLKIRVQIQQLSTMKEDHMMLQELFLIEQKIKYLIHQIQILFVDSFYFDDVPNKSTNERRVHQIVVLWNYFFEGKSDPFIDSGGWKYEHFNLVFLKLSQSFNNKHEEQLIKKIAFLKIATKFLIRDKLLEDTTFSSSVIIDLVLPKLDLSQLLASVVILQQKTEKPSQMTTQYLMKCLYKFYFNLLANTKQSDLRQKALKELSKSISLFFTTFNEEILYSKFNLLDYVANKIHTNYYRCNSAEQVQFFIEILSVANEQLYKIEEEFLFAVESCKGTVEGMRQLSLFRQLVQKAQGQKYQNISLGSILEKKAIDYKKVFQIIPLLSKCSSIFSDSINSQLRNKASSLIAELWVYLVLNNPFFMVAKKKKSQKEDKLTNDEMKDISGYSELLKEMYNQTNGHLNYLAFMTPNLLAQNKSSLLELKIVMLLTENKTTYTCQNHYLFSLHRQMKVLFRIKKKDFRNKLELQDLIFIVLLNEIFQRCLEEVGQNITILKNASQSFVNKFISFVKSEEEDESQYKEITSLSVTHQQLQSSIKKQIKFQSFLRESITRAAVQYTNLLQTQKGTQTKEIIGRDFIYLVQHSCSIDNTLSEYASNMCVDFIRTFPFVCFNPDVIKTFSELLTILHQKIGREFDSKSKYIQNEQFKFRVLLHTDQKILTQNIIFLMNCLLKLVFRGLYIDHNFIKVFCLHLIKQETSLMSELPFGYKFLKFMISSFKVDKEAIETFKDQADKYNPYFWLVKEVEFDNKISSSDLTQFVVDKGLIRLQKINIDQRIQYGVASEILKQIDYSIKNEIEFDFQAEDRIAPSIQVQPIMRQITIYCQQLNIAQYFSINKLSNNLKFLTKLEDLGIDVSDNLRQLARDSTLFKKVKSTIVRDILSAVTSLKPIMLNIQVKITIITQLLDIAKYFLQPQLLKFVLMRLIPFLHSISPNYFDSTFFFLLGEMLHYTIYQINNLGNLKYDKKISSQDIFQIKTNYFNTLCEFEIDEFSQNYLDILTDSTINLVNLAQIGYYEIRWKCLCKLHQILIRFLNDNMQIHLVKNVKLSVIANILKLNFLADKKIVEFIPLENVCEVLKGSIEIIQLMKEFKEKFKDTKDITVTEGQNSTLHPYSINQNLGVKFEIESFYYKTLKFGLNHFAKNVNLYTEPLFTQCANQARLVKRYQLYSIVCKYLSKDKLHELNEEMKITKLKRVKKRFNSVVFKTHRKEMLVINQKLGVRASVVMDGWSTSQMNRKLQADIGFGQKQLYAISFHTSNSGTNNNEGEFNVRPYYLRKALFFLLCDELDKIRGFAQKLQEELQSDYSILSQNKLSDNFIQQIISEIPDKNLNLAYQILLKLYPLMQNEDTLNQVFYKFLGAKITANHYQYLDCAHFFDIMVGHNIKCIDSIQKYLIYWKPPHIQILLKYITEQYENIPEVQLCFAKIMKRLHSEQIIFYLAQIVQSLASRSGQLIKSFLIEYSQQSVLFAHQLIWLAKVESKIDTDHKRPPSPKNMPPNYNILTSPEYANFIADLIHKGQVQSKQLLISKITPFIIKKVIRNMDSEQTAFFNKVDSFFERMTAISGVLRPQMSKPQKRELIAIELRKFEISQDIYMPTNPRFQIVSIKLDSGAPMQSAAKCPILVSFCCRKFEGPDKYFEKKRKMKKEMLLNMERTVKEQQQQLLFEMDPLPDDEDKGPLFINELVRPIMNQKFRQSMSSSRQQGGSQIMKQSIQSPLPLERKRSVEDRLHEIEKKKKLIKQQTTIQLEQENVSPVEVKSCIFKVFDDIRQDNLALQIINMFKGVFERCGLDLYVFPYKTISNRTGSQLNVGGIIEVVANTISRDQMGKTNRCSLYEYFINKFGSEDSLPFQIARENFIKSQAAYSIISYILQIKDRHNGNILISEKGHLIHIDFGFIFDISPGGNMKFENANFKLTQEMIQVMGGSQDSEAFKYYRDLTVRAFLAVRHYYEHMFYIVKLMVGSGLSCFMKDSLKNFTDRFQLRKNDLAAAKHMQDIIGDAYNKSTTKWYDDIQFYQNGISR